MRIEELIWLDEIIEKLAIEERVAPYEVEEVLLNKPEFRFVEKGNQKGEDVYLALGTTYGSRYLTILFVYKPFSQALILRARDMAKKERAIYDRK